MAVSFRVVVSTENSPYMAWQTQLFCFSAITRLEEVPIVIVHETGSRLLPEFENLRSLGCRLILAPSFVFCGKRLYPAKNEVGSLLWLSRVSDLDADNVLFCEPDMLFTQELHVENSRSAEQYLYMDYTESRVRALARKVGLDSATEILNSSYNIGVPYVLPTDDLLRLSRRWMALIDAFDYIEWIDIMYAFGLGAFLEGISFTINGFMIDNHDQMAPVDRPLIHYCYGDSHWDKRDYMKGPGPIARKALPCLDAPKGSVLAEVTGQIDEAREFYKRHHRKLWWPRMASTVGMAGLARNLHRNSTREVINAN